MAGRGRVYRALLWLGIVRERDTELLPPSTYTVLAVVALVVGIPCALQGGRVGIGGLVLIVLAPVELLAGRVVRHRIERRTASEKEKIPGQ